uniref:Uncharacterized protein n=1 Tax=Rhizophora mucronata TaxID=61149 RepID=A0A2P2NKQ4_RHIMU
MTFCCILSLCVLCVSPGSSNLVCACENWIPL